MLRLDKYLANLWIVSRREMNAFFKNEMILVNGVEAIKPNDPIAYGDVITRAWQDIVVKEFIYVLLHKPAGITSSDVDEASYQSYRTLLQDCPYVSMLHVAGRLDQDTEWLLIASNDGQFVHRIKSPKHHREKEYYVKCKNIVTDPQIKQLEWGIELDDGYRTLPAKATKIGDKELKLILHEGKFHQVKRMLQALGNDVIYLRRDRIGDYTLGDLPMGKWQYFEPKI